LAQDPNEAKAQFEVPQDMTVYYLRLLKRGPLWTPEETPEVERLQAAHVAYGQNLHNAGKLMLNGPLLDNGDLRGVGIFRVGSLAEAETLSNADPAVQANRLVSELHPWMIQRGVLPEEASPGGNVSSNVHSGAHAVADLAEGLILASVELAAPPERVFRALTSPEICDWWVRPGVFDTREWTGEVRVGGRWRASGVGQGRPYGLEGEFLEVDPPRELVHTWQGVGAPGAPTTVTYLLEGLGGGTRLTLRHAGFTTRWETSFERLAASLAAERPPSRE
jgi:uncharacterized protein YndB with AHSA1/START domain/uncharacterized protein YciI